MSEEGILNRARKLIDQGREEEASRLLWPLCESSNYVTRLNSVFALLNALDPFSDSERLVGLCDMGIETANYLGLHDEQAYLTSRKAYYLLNHLSMLVSRAKNLTLFGRIFRWIDFSLERDKEEFATLQQRRVELEPLIALAAATAEQLGEQCNYRDSRGRVFESIGDYYSMRFFFECLDLQRGGRIRAKIFNLRLIRRFNLTYFLYDREDRRKILSLKRKCFEYYERAIADFETENLGADIARASYNYSSKLMLTNHFRVAQKLLDKAKSHQDASDPNLGRQIEALEERIRTRNASPPDYVEALGLDMPWHLLQKRE